MIVIRLSRGGAKKRPFYHFVVTDRRNPRDGRFIEQLGYFNPVARGNERRIHLDDSRYTEWVASGAQPSLRVKKLLKEYKKQLVQEAANAVEKEKVKAAEKPKAKEKDKPAAKSEEKTDNAEKKVEAKKETKKTAAKDDALKKEAKEPTAADKAEPATEETVKAKEKPAEE